MLCRHSSAAGIKATFFPLLLLILSSLPHCALHTPRLFALSVPSHISAPLFYIQSALFLRSPGLEGVKDATHRSNGMTRRKIWIIQGVEIKPFFTARLQERGYNLFIVLFKHHLFTCKVLI